MHDFNERLAFSEGIELSSEAMGVLRNLVPRSLGVKRANESEDRSGTDYWVVRGYGLPDISIDVKHRGFCPIERFGADDVCIETTSVYSGPFAAAWEDRHRKKIGWTIDYTKRTDFIMYTWPAGNGLRYWIVPFVPLCRTARINWRAWASLYKERAAKNKDYLTLSVYPPRREIARAMKVLMSGVA